jgi:regulatory protein
VKKGLSLRERAIGLLARREHSRAELARKLLPHCAEGEDLEALLDDLARRKLLSDERYAEMRAHTLGRKFGAARIEHDLRRQGVADPLVERVVGGLKGTEAERAREAWQKRFGIPPQNVQEHGRQYRFLASRGFSAEVIHRLLRCSDLEL